MSKLGTIGVAMCVCSKSAAGISADRWLCPCGMMVPIRFYVPIEKLLGMSDAVSNAMVSYCSPDSSQGSGKDVSSVAPPGSNIHGGKDG